jgi:hypothetical protein
VKKCLFILFLIPFTLLGQETLNEHIENELSKLYKEEYSRKKEIKLDGKKYRIYSNYLTAGAGKCYNSIWNETMLATAIDFNFHLNKQYFQIGGQLLGSSFGNNQLAQAHLGTGYHKESYKYFWSAYGGLCLTDGYYPRVGKDINGNDSLLPLGTMKEVGIYAAFQAFYKIKFDYGIGGTLFADANSKEYTIGLRIELFFSGAFRGNIRHKDED